MIEGIKEKSSAADVWQEHKISRMLYCRCRDKFLEGGKQLCVHIFP